MPIKTVQTRSCILYPGGPTKIGAKLEHSKFLLTWFRHSPKPPFTGDSWELTSGIREAPMGLCVIRLQAAIWGSHSIGKTNCMQICFFNVSGVGKHSDRRVDAQQSQSRF
jgi:hypothetical protein